MIRSLKKLKIWSSRRKKKKKKQFIYSSYSPPPPPARPAPLPPPTHCCSCSAATPSAPPLPSWLDFEPNQITDSGSKDEIFYRETISETVSLYPPSAQHSNSTSPSSYQQYMVPNPAYGVPFVPEAATRADRSCGTYGCVLSVGTTLVRCFFPCFPPVDRY